MDCGKHIQLGFWLWACFTSWLFDLGISIGVPKPVERNTWSPMGWLAPAQATSCWDLADHGWAISWTKQFSNKPWWCQAFWNWRFGGWSSSCLEFHLLIPGENDVCLWLGAFNVEESCLGPLIPWKPKSRLGSGKVALWTQKAILPEKAEILDTNDDVGMYILFWLLTVSIYARVSVLDRS